MGRSSFFKDFFRTLIKSKMRFLSILAITALGVGFYAGITATEPDMILSADLYYQEQNLADFSLISPLGFREEDLDDVSELEGIESVQPGYFKDAYLGSGNGTQSTVRLYSFLDSDELNQPLVISGRLPEKSGEIAIESSSVFIQNPGINLGDSITLSLPDGENWSETLKTNTFTLVGTIQSPLYISFDRDQTQIGDGSVDLYGLISADDFIMDRYPLVFVRTTDSPRLMAYTDEYKDHLKPVESALNTLGKDSVGAETQKLRDEINKNKTELEEKKNQAEQELAEAKRELLDAENALYDGEKELEKSEQEYLVEIEAQKKGLAKGWDDYHAGMLTYYANYDQWLDGYTTWQDRRDELNDAKIKLDDAENQINQAERTLDEAKTELDEARTQLDSLQQALRSVKEIRQSLPESNPTLTESQFKQLIEDIRVYSPELATFIEENYTYDDPAISSHLIEYLDTAIIELEQTAQESEAAYKTGLSEYEAGVRQLEENKGDYEAGRRQVDQGFSELYRGKRELDSARAELDQGRRELDAAKKELDAGDAALARAERSLQQSLDEGYAELDAAREELKEGRAVYEKEKADALNKIAEAEEKIREAERQLIEIPVQWFVRTRDANPGYTGFGNDARRIGAVAAVFPFFFFLVAALVCLTTMTRMVEEERLQIGTLKALGYKSLTISAKYLFYALLATLSGSILGLWAGFWIFPSVIMHAYDIMYQIPRYVTPPHVDKAIISVALALSTTMLATLAASLNELRTVPARLMQPRAPKPGKHIFLEYIQPVWKRLSFSQKVAARNIFRYKQRLLMTIMGIAGCTALLLTGFGLKDSINAIVGKQFENIFLYDGQLMLDTDQDNALQKMKDSLDHDEEIDTFMPVLQESVTVMLENSSQVFSANLVVPENTDTFAAYYDLHERISRNDLSLNTGGTVISEKLSGLLSARAGDTITFRDADNHTYTTHISGIAENYMMHYLFMSPETFDRVTYRNPSYNGAVFNLVNPESLDQQQFQEELLEHDAILGSMLTLDLYDAFSKTIGSLDLVVLVLILSAGALAFIVLYNLTSINITERVREIATIKVLGFRDLEVSAYVFRENIVLTALGTMAGLLLGIVLHRFVMDTMEIDSIMFGKTIHWASYIFSVLLTLLFSVFVNGVMHIRLHKIGMVESLKSIE